MNTKPALRSDSNPAVAALILLLVSLPVFVPASAEVYLEFDFEQGGDTLASSDDGDLSAGGGYKLAVGLQRFIGGFDDVGLIFSLGYLFDLIDASNGDAEINAFVGELIYFRDFGPHRLGIGGSYHINPSYEVDLDGFAPLQIDFDNALGLVGRYGYVIDKGLEFGIRYTLIDYEVNGSNVDADSLGFYLSTAF